MNCQKMDLLEYEDLFERFERSEKCQIWLFCYFVFNFLKNCLIIFYLFIAYSFLEMILIRCEEMDLIELFVRSF